MLPQIPFEPLAQTTRLRPIFLRLLARQVDLLLRKGRNLAVANVLS